MNAVYPLQYNIVFVFMPIIYFGIFHGTFSHAKIDAS